MTVTVGPREQPNVYGDGRTVYPWIEIVCTWEEGGAAWIVVDGARSLDLAVAKAIERIP